MIEEFSGICHNTLSALLSIYAMQDWDMTWVPVLGTIHLRNFGNHWRMAK